MNIIRLFNLTLFLLTAAVPLALALGYALLYSLGATGVLNEGITLVNWYKTLINNNLWQSIGYSIYIAFITMIIAIGLALWAVVRHGNVFRSGYTAFLIYLPLTLPATVMGFYSFQLLAKSGLLSRLAFQVGLLHDLAYFPILINDLWGVGIIFTHICMATPFFIILFTNLYHNENLKDFIALAQTLGAKASQVTWQIIIPVLLQKSFATLVLYFVFIMSSYEIPLLLGSQSRQMISVFTIEKLQRFNLQDIPQAYAISVLYGLLLIILIINLLGRSK
ncbi:MAG TPA: ABC transporter permease subunit [Saprospiraceae bacterium]|nr:ABC transporter permease subunit [Saprospiraceae bacterium]